MTVTPIERHALRQVELLQIFNRIQTDKSGVGELLQSGASLPQGLSFGRLTA